MLTWIQLILKGEDYIRMRFLPRAFWGGPWTCCLPNRLEHLEYREKKWGWVCGHCHHSPAAGPDCGTSMPDAVLCFGKSCPHTPSPPIHPVSPECGLCAWHCARNLAWQTEGHIHYPWSPHRRGRYLTRKVKAVGMRPCSKGKRSQVHHKAFPARL